MGRKEKQGEKKKEEEMEEGSAKNVWQERSTKKSIRKNKRIGDVRHKDRICKECKEDVGKR